MVKMYDSHYVLLRKKPFCPWPICQYYAIVCVIFNADLIKIIPWVHNRFNHFVVFIRCEGFVLWRVLFMWLCSFSTFQATDPAVAEKIEEFIERLKKLKEVEEEFTLVSLADSKLQKNSMQLTTDSTLLLVSYNEVKLMNTSFDFYLQIIDDVSGNSFIENPFAPQKDTALTVTHYKRTPEQNAALGIEVRSCYSICCSLQLSVENSKISVSSTFFVSF